jgi:hypothetical protein
MRSDEIILVNNPLHPVRKSVGKSPITNADYWDYRDCKNS